MIAPNTVHCEDALVFLRGLDDASVDMILCDLPYGVHEASWDEVIPVEPMWEAFRRVMKPRGAIVLTATQPFTTRLISSNPTEFKYSWVWEKTMAGDFLNAKNKPLRAHEDVLVFSSGTTANRSPNRMPYYPQGLIARSITTRRPYSSKCRRDAEQIVKTRPNWKTVYTREYTNYPTSILRFANGNNDTLHPNQKPVELFRYLIRTYTRPGELVIDPCVGSGTSAVAARAEGRNYIVNDNSPHYVAVTNDRLRLPFSPRAERPSDLRGLPIFDFAEVE